MTEINANSPLHNINPPITGINPPLENGNPVNPVNNGVSAPEQNVVQKGTEVKSLSLKLDSMMIRAAQLATRSVDVNALAETVKDVPLDETVRTALDDAAERAKSALSELSQLSGREIAEAIEDKDGKLNFKADNEAADAIREAIDAQAELSEMLHKLVNSPHTDAAVADQLLEMALQCDRRQSEIMTLTMELTDAVHATGDNKELNQRLDKTLTELLPRQALSMHDNEGALEKMKAQLQPLADRMEAFAAKPNASITSEEYAALKAEVAEAAAAIAHAAKEGFPTEDGGRIIPDRTLLQSAEQLIRSAETKLNDTRKSIGMASVKAFVDSTFGISSKYNELLDREYLFTLENDAPKLMNAASIRYKIHELALQYMENNSLDIYSQMIDLAGEMAKIKPEEIKKEIKHCRELFGNGRSMIKSKDWQALTENFSRTFGMFSQIAHLQQMLKQVNTKLTPEQFLSTTSARALLEGQLAFNTLVEARIHGKSDADVDPALDDSRMESSETLGSGTANTVSLVTYKDGSEWVFKPEASGRQGMEHIVLSFGYKPSQQLAELNLVTYNVAKSLGMNDIIPKCSVGCHKSKYGTFMKKVPGLIGADFADGKKVKGSLTPEDIKKLPPDKYGLVMGRILRQLNRLEWLDKLMGQGDRHIQNYLIDVKEDLTVTVTGIDNDMCYPPYQTGLATYTLTAEQTSYFNKKKKEIINAYPSELQDEAKKRLDSDPGVKELPEGKLQVDVTKIEAGELQTVLRRAVGVRQPAIPDFIDKETYTSIMELKEGKKRTEYIAILKSQGVPSGAVNAAISRLDETIAHAEKLANEGKVIEIEDFAQKDVQNKLLAKELHMPHPIKPLGPNNFKLEGDAAREAQEQVHSIFCRDLFKALERPGWFA